MYSSQKLSRQCTEITAAGKLFGGDKVLARSLLARINLMQQSSTLKDIVLYSPCRFHKLTNKLGRNLEGFFVVDVRNGHDAWRIVLEPLDENELPYEPCRIDEIADITTVIRIKEVSRHYG